MTALGAGALDRFLTNLQRELQNLQFASGLVGWERMQTLSRARMEAVIGTLQQCHPDIVLGAFPDEDGEDEEEWGVYHDFKSITIGRGIAGQMVYQHTLSNSYAMANIVLGILGKAGTVPFVLADPLNYADLVVSIDIARRPKERLTGTINATAIARLYFSDGEFLRYVIHDAPLEGETIPDHVLQRLFPLQEFGGRRVVVHRDGYFRGDEKQMLRRWAEHIGAEVYLVEVIKPGTPGATDCAAVQS